MKSFHWNMENVEGYSVVRHFRERKEALESFEAFKKEFPTVCLPEPSSLILYSCSTNL